MPRKAVRKSFLISNLLIGLICLFFLSNYFQATAQIDTPSIAYIYSDTVSAASYESFLVSHDYEINLISMADITQTNLSYYSLIIIGPDTGYISDWGNSDQILALKNANKPVIGLGEGGYAFFGKLYLDIGYGNGAHGFETSVTVVDNSHSIFRDKNFSTSESIQLYSVVTNVVLIHMPSPGENVVLLGGQSQSHYYPIIQEKRFLLWGFDGSPETMTQIGKDIFIEIVTFFSSYSPQNIPTPSSIFGLVVIIISLLLTLVGIYVVALNVYIKPQWPVVNGTIISCKVKKNFMEVNDQPRYHVVIFISYSVGGSSYEVKKSSGRDASSYSLKRKYSEGKKIALHYNPRNPKQIALEPDVRWSYGIFPVITFLILNLSDFSTNPTFLGIPLVFLEGIVELVIIFNVLILIVGAIYSFQDRTRTWEEETEKKVPPIIPKKSRFTSTDYPTCHHCGTEMAKEAIFCTKCGTKLEEEPIIQKKTYIVKPEIIVEKEEVESSVPSLKPFIPDVTKIETVETSPTISTTTKEDIIPEIQQEKPVSKEIKAKFSSIQYMVQDIIYESDSLIRIIPYSGSIKEISVEFSQSHVVLSGCLTQQKMAISNLEIKIEGKPRPYSWDNPWQDITLLGEEKIINRLKNRTELANRLISLGTAVLKVNTIAKGDICVQVTCNDNDDVIKNAYSLITDIKSFIEISLY